MSTLAISRFTRLIIATINNTTHDKGKVLQRLLSFHRGYISDNEVIEIIDYYKRRSVVIEAVLASGALTESAAYRMLRLYPRNQRYRDLVDKAYGHVQTLPQDEPHFPYHENILDGKMVQAHA